ncbi:MAG: hypothetical protein AB8G77_22570 [Rhodothermales bacterium]
MQQTLYALMALALTSMLSFTQLNSQTQSYTRLIDDELEVMGSGVLRRVLETADILSFDQRTTPTVWNANGGVVPLITEYETQGSFGNTPQCDLDEPFKNLVGCDDIDDLDMGSLWQPIPFFFPNGDSLVFEANVRVYYVAAANLDAPLPSGVRSEFKLVEVKIRTILHASDIQRYNNGFIQLRRVYNFNQELAEDRAAAGP